MELEELEALLGNPNSCVRDSLNHLWYPKHMGPELGVMWDQRLVGASVSVAMRTQTLWDTFGPLTEVTHPAVVVFDPEPDNVDELEYEWEDDENDQG